MARAVAPDAEPIPASVGRTRRALVLARFWGGIGALFVCSAAAALLAMAVLPAALPSWTATAVGSGSMRPALGVGDVVVLRSPGDQALAPPAVVLIDRSDNDQDSPPLLHRVVSYDPARGYTTKGDANDQADSDPVAPDRVLGVGRLLVPYVGWPALWIERGQWLLLAAATVAGVLMVRLARYGWDSRYDPWPARPAGPARPAPPAGPTQATRPAGPARPDGPAPTAGPAGPTRPTRPPGPDRTAVPGRSRRWPTTLLVLALVALMAAGWLGPDSSRSAFSDTTGNTGNRIAADTLQPVTGLTATPACTPAGTPQYIARSAASADVAKITLTAPASVQAGDLLVAHLLTEMSSFNSTPAPFTQVFTTRSSKLTSLVMQKVATSGDAGSSFTWSVPSGAGVLMIFRGAAPVSASDTAGTIHEPTKALTAPSLTGAAGFMLVGLYSVAAAGQTIDNPGMMQSIISYPGNSGVSMSAARQLLTTDGQTGTRRATSPITAHALSQSLLIRPKSVPSITLSWSPSASTYATGYSLQRDGADLATLTGRSTTTATDSGVPPGTRTYTVTTTAGTWRSSSTSINTNVSC